MFAITIVKSTMQNNLIFDIGLHVGKDARFYLDKGFNVVGLEANPILCRRVKKDFASEIKQSRLHVVEKALFYKEHSHVDFYIHPTNDDWGSLLKEYGQRQASAGEVIKVPTVTLSDLYDQYGVPYYIKCDIEGSDGILVHQLLYEGRRPTFISIEAVAITDLARLFGCGYDRFQIINQQQRGYDRPPSSAREGQYVDTVFDGYMSGLFGLELDQEKWIDFDEACERFLLWRKLLMKDQNLTLGWLDFHAGQSSFINNNTHNNW
jgi:FkbM family methyltransferase